MTHVEPQPTLYGLMAEFDRPGALVVAATATREAGYRQVDAYSPFPIEDLHHAIGFDKTKLPLIVLGGGFAGCLIGFAMQWWMAVIAYPLNIGGKPLNSWPSFIPVTFEMTVLLAALSSVVGMIALNGLPMPYHPVFNVPRFALASRDRFFLCIEAKDAKFDLEDTRRFLETLSPREVTSVAD
jgi:hypothetical protein